MIKQEINKRIVLTGLMIGMFFSALEQTVVGTAMPTIIAQLNGFSIFAWVTTAYMIASTTVIPIVGKLSDQFGRRGLYLLGVIIFVISSGLCATATNMEQLILYRGIQGIGGGMIMPLSQTIIGDIFTAEQRAKWQAVFGALFGISSVIGPFIGGFLVDNISWHWIFLINIPFGLISAALIFIGLKHESVGKKERVKIDFAGIFTLIPAIILMLIGLTFGGDKFAWASTESGLIFGGSLFMFIVFLFVERKAADPVLELSLFKNRVFAVTNGLGFLLGLGMFGAIMFVPMFMQAIIGVTPTHAGSTMTPMMISLIVASVIGGRLLLRLRYRTVLTVGMLITSSGFLLMSTMGLDSKEMTAYMYMIVLGFGMGLVMPTLMITVQNEFPKTKLGAVTSASTFFRSIGGTIGITILNVVMNHSLKTNITNTMHAEKNPMASAILEKIGAKTDALFGLLIKPEMLKVPEDIKKIVLHDIASAWSQSFNTVFLTGIIFIGAGVFVALLVGNGRIKRDQKPTEAQQEENFEPLLNE